MKIGVIGGAGVLGSAAAFCFAAEGLADTIVLYDVRKNLAVNHAIDIDQGVCEISQTRTSVGSFVDLSDSDLILIVAGAAAEKIRGLVHSS